MGVNKTELSYIKDMDSLLKMIINFMNCKHVLVKN